jgi:hypothetical protein
MKMGKKCHTNTHTQPANTPKYVSLELALTAPGRHNARVLVFLFCYVNRLQTKKVKKRKNMTQTATRLSLLYYYYYYYRNYLPFV